MQLFRMGRSAYITDLAGAGPRMYGGRWNHKGIAVVYVAESRSLATLEFLVHVPLLYEPPDLSIATVVVPDGVSLREVQMSELPAGWNRYPAAGILADLGSALVRSVGFLLLRVPSAVVDGEFNVLINPAHHEMAHVRIAEIRPYAFDPRLVTRGNRKV